MLDIPFKVLFYGVNLVLPFLWCIQPLAHYLLVTLLFLYCFSILNRKRIWISLFPVLLYLILCDSEMSLYAGGRQRGTLSFQDNGFVDKMEHTVRILIFSLNHSSSPVNVMYQYINGPACVLGEMHYCLMLVFWGF